MIQTAVDESGMSRFGAGLEQIRRRTSFAGESCRRPKHSTIGGPLRIQSARLLIGDAEIQVGLPERRIRLQGPLEEGKGVGRVVLLNEQDPQAIQRAGKAAIAIERLAVRGFGSGHVSCLPPCVAEVDAVFGARFVQHRRALECLTRGIGLSPLNQQKTQTVVRRTISGIDSDGRPLGSHGSSSRSPAAPAATAKS